MSLIKQKKEAYIKPEINSTIVTLKDFFLDVNISNPGGTVPPIDDEEE